MPTSFTVNWDYHCPYAHNADEHVIAGLEAGADRDRWPELNQFKHTSIPR